MFAMMFPVAGDSSLRLMVIKEIFAGAVEELSVGGASTDIGCVCLANHWECHGGQTSDEEKPAQAPSSTFFKHFLKWSFDCKTMQIVAGDCL